MIKPKLAAFSQRLIYEDYKRRIDVREVLTHYGAENCSETRGSDDTTEIVHSCLVDQVEPHHRNADANPSASANVEKKLYCCYAYWSGDIFHLIAKMERKDHLRDIIPVLGQFLSGATSTQEDFQAELEALFARQSSIIAADLPSYAPRVLDPWTAYHHYLARRGISVDAAALLQLGYDQEDDRIVIPHFWRGSLVGWQKRGIVSTQIPKYKNSTHFPKSETLYAYDLVTGEGVVVVESPMSVAKAYSLGVPNVVATFGSSVNEAQIELLRGFPRVTVWFDGDPAGRKGEKKLVTGLYRHCGVDVVVPDGDRDLADCTSLKEVSGMLNNAVPAVFRMAEYDVEERYGR